MNPDSQSFTLFGVSSLKEDRALFINRLTNNQDIEVAGHDFGLRMDIDETGTDYVLYLLTPEIFFDDDTAEAVPIIRYHLLFREQDLEALYDKTRDYIFTEYVK